MSAARPVIPGAAYISLGAFIVLAILAIGLFVLEPDLVWLGWICLGVAVLNLVGAVYSFMVNRNRIR